MYRIKININCNSCISKIEDLLKHYGTLKDYSFKNEEILVDVPDGKIISFIVQLKRNGFEVEEYKKASYLSANKGSDILLIILLLALFIVGRNMLPQVDGGNEFSIVLVIVFAVLSSMHCISMCGPIALKQHNSNTQVMYYIGRIISYSSIGFVLGLLGNVISINETFMSVVMMVSGVFLVLLGLSFLDIIKLPSIKLKKGKSTNDGLVAGLLNGVMPCAILQVAWLYVVTLQSPIQGMIVMFIIAVVSSITLFGFGKLSTLVSFFRSHTFKIILASYIIFMGAGFVANGFTYTKAAVAPTTESSDSNSSSESTSTDESATSTKTSGDEGSYDNSVTFTMNYKVDGEIKVGETTRIYFDTAQSSGCNYKFTITWPDGQVSTVDTKTDEYIDVTITEEGTAYVNCWMGMQRGSIEVVK